MRCFLFRGEMIFLNCLAQKCTLPGQLNSKNKPFKINFWILKPMKSLYSNEYAQSTFSD